MRKNDLLFCRVAIALAAVLSLPLIAAAQSESALYRFTGAADGGNPSGGLVGDPEGNLYGTTSNYETSGDGTIFELSPPTSGYTWTFQTIFTFTDKRLQGSAPLASLLRDSAGNLYGTASAGGGVRNCGSVFRLGPPTASGQRAFTSLHVFTGFTDGCAPFASLIMDASGNLYGTTYGGGDVCIPWSGCSLGVVFELSPPSVPGEKWTENILYRFGSIGGIDGASPEGGLVFDKNGWLYGTTAYSAGFTGIGTVFALSPPSVPGGTWTQHILYSFQGGLQGSSNPAAGVVFDPAGNLYGTTTDYQAVYGYYCSGGAPCGHVFELSPPTRSGQPWTYSAIWSYTGGCDGDEPVGPVTLDTRGNVYATTEFGGCMGSVAGGTVIELSPPAVSGAAWTETTLHQFDTTSGSYKPYGNVIFGPDGRLYGTLYAGGLLTCANWADGCGSVFALSP
jgi:hypothetical protein